jgi:membrane associated rhomboid family serine protease
MKWTWLLIALNVLVFILTLSDPDYYLSLFGFSAKGFIAGNYYTAISSMFMHAGILHLAGNMVALLALGGSVEKKVSGPQFFGAYFLAGFAGLLSPFIPIFGYGYDAVFVGASAAISGLVGLGIFTCPGKFVWFQEIVPLPFAVAGALFLLTTLSGVLTAGEVAESGHFLGFLVGAVLGIAWTKERVKNILIFGLVLALIIFFPLILQGFNSYFGLGLRF